MAPTPVSYTHLDVYKRQQYGYDKDEFLAAALGITVDELNAAELTAYQLSLIHI